MRINARSSETSARLWVEGRDFRSDVSTWIAVAEVAFDYVADMPRHHEGAVHEIEVRPTEESEQAPGFADATRLVSSQKLLERLDNHPDEQVDARAYLKARLLDNTERSVARGTFGSPAFFVGDEIFFGKDRLRDVEEAILAVDVPAHRAAVNPLLVRATDLARAGAELVAYDARGHGESHQRDSRCAHSDRRRSD